MVSTILLMGNENCNRGFLNHMKPKEYGYLTIFFVFSTTWVYIPCKNLHTWAKSPYGMVCRSEWYQKRKYRQIFIPHSYQKMRNPHYRYPNGISFYKKRQYQTNTRSFLQCMNVQAPLDAIKHSHKHVPVCVHNFTGLSLKAQSWSKFTLT